MAARPPILLFLIAGASDMARRVIRIALPYTLKRCIEYRVGVCHNRRFRVASNTGFRGR